MPRHAGTEEHVTTAPIERLPVDETASPARPSTPSGLELADLVERARHADASAWEALYRLLYPRLLAYARRQLDDERAKDAVSETMARAVAGIGRFTWKGAGFEGWMFSILRHVVLDAHRKGARARVLPAREVDDGAEVADSLLRGEEAHAVRAAFVKLRPEERELLHLRVVAGLSSEAVAQVLGKRPGAVRMSQARALERLRRLLEDGDQ